MITYSSLSKNIYVNLDLDNIILLNIDTVIPLGLIINELLTNALKYAFPENTKGEINLSLHLDNNLNIWKFIFKDNGKGLPSNFDIKTIQSLGLKLVLSLTQQIEGELKINNVNGTEFTIQFKVYK
jgi:two-component sensor histidine kinase